MPDEEDANVDQTDADADANRTQTQPIANVSDSLVRPAIASIPITPEQLLASTKYIYIYCIHVYRI